MSTRLSRISLTTSSFYDPHYPYKDMKGIAAVREGLMWAFGGMKSMGFDIDRWFLSDDGTKITKMRAYEPYGPGGGVGFGLAIGHTIYRLTHRKMT